MVNVKKFATPIWRDLHSAQSMTSARVAKRMDGSRDVGGGDPGPTSFCEAIGLSSYFKRSNQLRRRQIKKKAVDAIEQVNSMISARPLKPPGRQT
jgi:hypothetical protein